jgi:hypothetical protein
VWVGFWFGFIKYLQMPKSGEKEIGSVATEDVEGQEDSVFVLRKTPKFSLEDACSIFACQ